jgi:hypothetical protein
MQTVHVRINDTATGQPTSARVRFTDDAGNYFAPFGRLADFATARSVDVGGNVRLDGRAFALVDGSFEIRLPPDSLHVEVHKGPEFRPLVQAIHQPPGKMALRLTMKRWIDLRRERWYSGDARCHFLAPHAALLEAAAEDLAVVNLLAMPSRVPGAHGREHPALASLLAFSGQRPIVESPGHLVVVNTRNSHARLGSLALLNCHRVVYPLQFGPPEGLDNWTLADWCDQCHRKGGLVVWSRPERGPESFRFGEPLADLILGKVDAFEISADDTSPADTLADWYRLLAAGLRVPLVGASGKAGNDALLGAMRTYARLLPDEVFGYRSWIEAVRAGRTFATTGPLLTFEVAGQDVGSVVRLSAGTERVRVRAEARALEDFGELEIVADGAVVASARASGAPFTATLDMEVAVPRIGWLAARCPSASPSSGSSVSFAHTSPVYVEVEGMPRSVDRAAVRFLADELDAMRTWANDHARCETLKQRADLLAVFDSARAKLLAETQCT